jgi:predicted choloylglycine hydrolase
MYHGRFKGSHYDAGYRWGKLLFNHSRSLEVCPTFTPDDIMRIFAKSCRKVYQTYYPELLAEIQGIADGQQLDPGILETILFNIYCVRFAQHCTCFAFHTPEETVFGRNSDFLVSVEKLVMNCLYALDGSYAFNGNTTAYVEMEDGVNVHGLAAGLCFVYPKRVKPGFNAGMLVRYILEKCKTTGEAIAALKNLPIASSQTITVADSNADIAVIECNAEKCVVIQPGPDARFVAAANCFVSPEMRPYRNTEIDDWRADERYRTAHNALAGYPEKYAVRFAEEILAGKFGFMCQYDRKTNADTVWSVVYDLKRKQIWRAEGNPSRKTFKADKRFDFL